jgi:hypothetical protein
MLGFDQNRSFFHFIFNFTAECSVLLTTNQTTRGGKTINLKKTVDAALECCPTVKHIFVSSQENTELKLGKRDICVEKVCFALEQDPKTFGLVASSIGNGQISNRMSTRSSGFRRPSFYALHKWFYWKTKG